MFSKEFFALCYAFAQELVFLPHFNNNKNNESFLDDNKNFHENLKWLNFFIENRRRIILKKKIVFHLDVSVFIGVFFCCVHE